MTLSARDLEDLLRELLPAGDPRLELSLAGDDPVLEHEDGGLTVRIRIAVFEPDDDRVVRDVKEQELRLLTGPQRADSARVAAYLRAWTGALGQIVDHQYGGEVDTIMPCDLLFPEALATDARALDDFRALFASAETLAGWRAASEAAELDATLEYHGLGDFKAELRALRRPAIRLAVDLEDRDDDENDTDDDNDDDEADEPASPIGASRIGGLPDLPPGTAWPRLDGVPLSFLAQIDLAEVRGYPGAEALPPAGLLSFFHDASGRANVDEHGKWAWPVRHRGGVQVLHLVFKPGDAAELVRTAAPDDRELQIFPVYEVRPVSERMMPAMESPFYEALDPASVHDAAWYARFARAAGLDESDPERPAHRLLGYTSELQGDPYLQAHLYASGQDFGEDWQREGARERALQREATRWRLLLQIDSEPGNTLLNQDGGFFYFMIHEDDLAAGRFDRVWGIAHGH